MHHKYRPRGAEPPRTHAVPAAHVRIKYHPFRRVVNIAHRAPPRIARRPRCFPIIRRTRHRIRPIARGCRCAPELSRGSRGAARATAKRCHDGFPRDAKDTSDGDGKRTRALRRVRSRASACASTTRTRARRSAEDFELARSLFSIRAASRNRTRARGARHRIEVARDAWPRGEN